MVYAFSPTYWNSSPVSLHYTTQRKCYANGCYLALIKGRFFSYRFSSYVWSTPRMQRSWKRRNRYIQLIQTWTYTRTLMHTIPQPLPTTQSLQVSSQLNNGDHASGCEGSSLTEWPECSGCWHTQPTDRTAMEVEDGKTHQDKRAGSTASHGRQGHGAEPATWQECHAAMLIPPIAERTEKS